MSHSLVSNAEGSTDPRAHGTSVQVAAARTRGVVFSKDRPLQLEATLSSFYRRCSDADSVALAVLFTCSDDAQWSAYAALSREFPQVDFVRETDFRGDLLALLAGGDLVLFLVDDTLFTQPFTMAEVRAALAAHPDALGFSLRLGQNTTYCYSMDAAQRLPIFREVQPDTLKYDWTSAELDFGYPLEVSSSVYRVGDLLPLLNALPFHHPNSLEELIAHSTAAYREHRQALLCYARSVAFSAPLNRVQSSHPNRASARPELSSASLLARFAAGERVDVDAYAGFLPQACHQEVVLRLVPRAPALVTDLYEPCLRAVEKLLSVNKLGEAVAALEAFAMNTSFHPAAIHDLAVLYVAQGRREDARRVLESALAAHPGAEMLTNALADLGPAAAAATPAPVRAAPPAAPVRFVATPGPGPIDGSRYTTPATCQIPNLAEIYTQHLGFRRDGVFVEVGAFDGEYVSNTSNLADLGWQGYYIEPVPEHAAACRARHARNPHTKVFELAISDHPGTAEIFVGGPLSTMSAQALELFQSFPWAQGFHTGRKVVVEQITLDQFLIANNIAPGFDVLSIDVEGFELNVMRGFDLARWAPRLAIVELHDENEAYVAVQDQCRAVAQRFAEQGYRAVFKDKTNTVYLR
jgi:FkbM family methyltransferase